MHWLFLIDRKWLFLFGSTWLIQPDANSVELSEPLLELLETLKNNETLRKTKILWISDKKTNNLNLFLLKKKYNDELITAYLKHLSDREIKILTTYGSLSYGLRKFTKRSIM